MTELIDQQQIPTVETLINNGIITRAVPEWMEEHIPPKKQVEVLKLTPEGATGIAETMRGVMNIETTPLPSAQEQHSGQKEYKATEFFNSADEILNRFGIAREDVKPEELEELERRINSETEEGIVLTTPQGVITIRHAIWLKEEDGGSIPDYAVNFLGLKQYEEEYSPLNSETDVTLQKSGHELEFQVIAFDEDGQVVAVDIQHLLPELKKLNLPFKPEGWVSQCEYVSMPRNPNEGLENYRNRVAEHMKILSSALRQYG